MALTIKKLPVRANSKIVSSVPDVPRKRKVRSDASDPTGQSVSMTVRMPPGSLSMLDRAVETYESNRSEVIKNLIRRNDIVMSSHNAVLILTDKAGKEVKIQLMTSGVPI